MEICTYVVEGDLTHQDSMGNGESLGRGSIQFMTAGTGVMHQEHNKNPKSPLRFIQMWIVPASRGLKPNYGSMRGDEMKAARQNAWAHMVSDVKDSAVTTPVKINQVPNWSWCGSRHERGTELARVLASGREHVCHRTRGFQVVTPQDQR